MMTSDPGQARLDLVRRARWLAQLGLAWHFLEATVAFVAGAWAHSIALVGFGADSVVEALAGVVLLWRFSPARAASPAAERTAQRFIGISFYAIAAYILVDALWTLATRSRPEASWLGIGLSIVTLATMPPLARAKARVGTRLGSSATRSEGRQNMLCAYLSLALLVGLTGNALFALWWLDPAVALGIAIVAAREGRDAFQGKACDCC